jgi:hypothetical protein
MFGMGMQSRPVNLLFETPSRGANQSAVGMSGMAESNHPRLAIYRVGDLPLQVTSQRG